MITPPVAPPASTRPTPSSIPAELTALQKLVKADKSAVVAALIHVAVLLVAALGMHLNATDVAILGSIVTSGVTYFVGLNLRTQARSVPAK